jgi:hypothetical protein
MNRFTLFALLPLVTLTPSISSAQWRDPDTTVRALGAAPVSHHGNASSAVAVMHPSGDLVIAADGVLMADPEGRTRWHAPEPATTDVAVAPDGSVFGMARLPAERPVTLRIDAFDPDGTPRWSQTLHAGRVDRYTYPDMTTAPDGDVLVCSTVRRGRRTPVIIDRLGPGGVVRWSRTILPHGECSAIATDATGALYWAGHETAGGLTRAVIERLDPSGNAVWRASYDANPLPGELAIVGDALTVAGSFIGQIDLLPGAPDGLAVADGYKTFVTRLDARTGDASWAWVGSNLCLSSIATRGSEVLVLEDGTMTRLASTGTELEHRAFGQVRSSEGLISMPTITATAILVDARGEAIFVGGIPSPEFIAFDDYFLWSGRPYHGPNGAVIGRPGW